MEMMRRSWNCRLVGTGQYRFLPTLAKMLILTLKNRFGMDCIYKWLSPTNIPNKNTCPKCRAILFEIDHSGYSDEETDNSDDGYNDADYIPELYALLDLRTFASFVAALNFVEPFMRGNIEIPRGFTYSKQILALFCAFPQASASDEDRPNESMFRDIAAKLAALMGRLYVRFHADMYDMHIPTPWREDGPRVRDLLDQEMHDMILVGIYHFMSFEEMYAPDRTRTPSN